MGWFGVGSADAGVVAGLLVEDIGLIGGGMEG